ncbi:response regulator [Corynebacterium epidermidicanis]|uniref:Two component transcriptional regulator, LuxR family n=1 Tax=Corynebacterium epidermidicanis TaxID=1050174 RepID=A0A0G3GV39_9CORY|nr:response regulator transcription factor [Corynebacterium epidermidicanis]AKK03398.1 two component transcriptional regulator, LuxR family [Corynebacterium epidermidicanis]
MIRLLLADDHPVIRAGLTAVLEAEPDFEVVAEAATADDAVALVKKHAILGTPIDLVLMDLRFNETPGANTQAEGVRATAEIRALKPAPEVLVITNYSSDAEVIGAVSAGAVGYLLKDSDPDVLIDGVRAASRGESVLSNQVATRLMGRMRQPETNLTAREHEVLTLVAEGMSNREIARKLVLTEATVKSHLGHVFSKLGVASRTAAVVEARKRAIL